MDELAKNDLTEVKVINKSNLLGKEIEVYGSIENPLFLAKDVADWIEHSDVSTMMRTVDEDEKDTKIVCTLGGNQKMWFLTENGLYEVLMLSRKPIAKEFKKGIKKILHEIRTKGGYMVAKQDDTPETIMARAIIIAQSTMERQKQQIASLQADVKKLTPDAEYTQNILKSESTWNTNVIAKEFGMSAVTLNKHLQQLGIQYKQHGMWLLAHDYQNKGYTKTKTYDYLNSRGEVCSRIQTEWTEVGRKWLHRLHDEKKF